MAAHVLTAFAQLSEDIDEQKLNWNHLQSALDYSTWTEQLDMDEYADLQKIVTAKSIIGLVNWLGTMFVKYQQEWVDLDRPRTKEEWVNRRWERMHQE